MVEMPETYYSATRILDIRWSRLNGDRRADVAVIGGGLAGLTAARELARGGKSVILLESVKIGYGASGRNGGFVSPGFAEGVAALVKRLGPDHARELLGLSRDGAQYVARTIEDLAMKGVEPVPGWLNLQRFDNERQARDKAEALAAFSGRPVEFWPTDKVRACLGTETYFQGIYDPDTFHMHPLNYALQLARGAESVGAELFEQSPVLDLRRTNGGLKLNCAAGSVSAGQVVVAGSAYLGRLYPKLSRAVLPVATHVMVSAPLNEVQARAIRFTGAITDTRRAGDYYRLLPDIGDGPRLLWGGRITTRRAEPRHLADLMKGDAVKIYPQFSDLAVDYAWSGLMGYAVHKMPIIKQMEPGIWACTAFGGHGLNTTAMGGVLVAEAIMSGDDRYRLFAPFKARWGGGMIGRIATQSAYWAMQLSDWWEEARSSAIR